MQKRVKLLAATAAAAMLTLGAGLAHADRGGEPGCGPGRGGPGMMGRQLLERYDANKDGTATKDEIEQNRAQWLKDFDADKNGTLSLEEFKLLWLKARNEMMVREFQFFDRDGNGQVTIEEYQAPAERLASAADRPMRRGDGPRWRHGPSDGHRMGAGPGHCEARGDGPPPPPPGDQPPPPPADQPNP